MVILSEEEEQAKSNTNVNATTSPITLEQITQLVVSGHEKMLATIHQRMIDKSLGKQPLTNDGSVPRFNIDCTFQHNTMPLEPSAAHAPHYGMPINLYNGQKS